MGKIGQKRVLAMVITAFMAGLAIGLLSARLHTVSPASRKDAGIEGINLRADFNPQSALLLGANEIVRYYPDLFVDMVRAVSEVAPVIALVNDSEEYNTGRKLLADAGIDASNVYYLGVRLNSMWVRDYGPIFVSYDILPPKVVDADYSVEDDDKERWLDNDFATLFANMLGLEVRQTGLRMEGGNLLSNGDGLCVTTTALIRRNTTRGYTTEQIGRRLNNIFGFHTWMYLEELVGESTGHVDMFVTFLDPNLALVAAMDPAVDAENAAVLDKAAALLDGLDTSLGPLRVHRLPMPPPVDGQWRTYNNVVLINGRILVPVYSDVEPELQEKALAVYRDLMPAWQVIPVNADGLLEAKGLLRCCTIPIPDGVDWEVLQTKGFLYQ